MSSKSADGAPVLLLNMGQPPGSQTVNGSYPSRRRGRMAGFPADPEKVAGKTRVRAGRGRFSADGARALARSRGENPFWPHPGTDRRRCCVGVMHLPQHRRLTGGLRRGPDHAGRGKGGCGALPSVFHAARRNPEMRTNGASRYKGVGSRRAAPSSPCASSWPRRSVCPCCPWLASPRSIQRRAPA